jgi:sugar phosphate isomerase/epimerase
MTRQFQIAMTTFGFLYRASLDEALALIASAGYRQVELAVGPPHFESLPLTSAQAKMLRRRLDGLGLACVSVNPLELNPVTENTELFTAARRQYQATIELAAELGARSVVMVAGRRSPLVPMPLESANRLLESQLEFLLPIAERLQVELTIEAVPYGFIETASQALAFAQRTGLDGRLRLTLDCANVFFAGADPADELRAASAAVGVVHISDTWRKRWAHTQIGQGEVDIEAFAAAGAEIDFDGVTVYELADSEDPAPRLRPDLAALADLGWVSSFG